ncbi:MAG: YlqD family protein [Armatimonadetes bacterium]|nr:YlqD family protein [Armatimonadota bacterium]
MQLRRTVTLKVVVTEKYQEEQIKALEDAIGQVEAARSQIDFRSRIYLADLQRQDLSQAAEFRRRIEAEKQRHQELREHLEGQLEEMRALNVGDEHTRGTLEGYVDLQVGDNFQEKMGGAELILKDDVVVEFRERQPEPELVVA